MLKKIFILLVLLSAQFIVAPTQMNATIVVAHPSGQVQNSGVPTTRTLSLKERVALKLAKYELKKMKKEPVKEVPRSTKIKKYLRYALYLLGAYLVVGLILFLING